jgi:hypothetical protein
METQYRSGNRSSRFFGKTSEAQDRNKPQVRSVKTFVSEVDKPMKP